MAGQAERRRLTKAYWVADSARPTKSQGVTQGRLIDDDDMPVLPRSKKRLIGNDDSLPPNDALEVPSTSRRRVGRTQVTQATQAARTATRRAARPSSVVSNTSDISEAPSGHTRSHDARSKPAAKGKQRVESIVVEDSEEEVAQDLGRVSSGSARAKGSTAPGTRGSRGTRGTTSTLEEGARGVPGTKAMDPLTSSVASSVRATGRRRLLVDDDEDDEAVPVSRSAVWCGWS